MDTADNAPRSAIAVALGYALDRGRGRGLPGYPVVRRHTDGAGSDHSRRNRRRQIVLRRDAALAARADRGDRDRAGSARSSAPCISRR